MVKAGIKNLLIDFGGVLIDLDLQRCVANFQQLGLQGVESLLGIYHQEDFLQRYEKGQLTTAQFRDQVRACAGHPVADAEIDRAWNSFLVGIPAEKLELLLQLRQRYRLFLLSNTNELHWQWSLEHAFPYQGQNVEDYFERIYLSFRLNLAKPDPAIFRTVLEDAELRPEETLFIDDSVENCRVAETFGIAVYTPEPHEDWSHLFR